MLVNLYIVWFSDFWFEDYSVGASNPEVIYSAFLFVAIKSTFFHVINFPVSSQLFGLFFFLTLHFDQGLTSPSHVPFAENRLEGESGD